MHKTPIYEIFELFFNFPLSPVRDTNYTFNNINNAEPNKLATLPNVTLEIGKELIRMAEKPKSNFLNSFKERFLLKIKFDLKSRFYMVGKKLRL